MTYRMATQGLARYGIQDGEARIECNGWKCGAVFYVRTTSAGGEPAWLLSGKSPPGWISGLNADGSRWDNCPQCRKVTPAVAARKS